MNNDPAPQVGRRCQCRRGAQRLVDAEARELADVGEGGVGQGEGRGAGVGAGHVGDAVVEDAVDRVDRIVVCGGAAGGGAAPLVDGDVDDYGTALHAAEALAIDHYWSAAAGGVERADHQIGAAEFFLQGVVVED